MTLEERYLGEIPTPAAATAKETIRCLFEEIQRRAFHSTRGLSDADLNADPGKGAMSIGQLLQHQLNIALRISELLRPGSMADVAAVDIGAQGAWNLDAICRRREELNERFRQVLAAVPDNELMAKRSSAKPEAWKDWTVMSRMIRLITDLAAHTGQVNYARRQLGKPVGK